MAALHGRLLVETVLRPFAEHLVAMVRPQPGDTCVDVSGDGGAIPLLIARRAPGAHCIAVDHDESVLRDITDQAALLHRVGVDTLRAPIDAMPLPDGVAACTTSLFAVAHASHPAAALAELLRITDAQRGRIACALWSEPGAAPHEGALVDALHEVTGDVPDALQGQLAYGYPAAADNLVARAGATGRLHALRVHDVVRFDGIAHWWAAMVSERPTAAAVAALPADTQQGIRDAAERHLVPHTAADGTMRIPVEAVVLASLPG